MRQAWTRRTLLFGGAHLPWPFVSERRRSMTRQAVNDLLGGIGEGAGLGCVRPPMLRHSCGFALANRGHDLRPIQDHPGHRDPRHTAPYTPKAAVGVPPRRWWSFGVGAVGGGRAAADRRLPPPWGPRHGRDDDERAVAVAGRGVGRSAGGRGAPLEAGVGGRVRAFIEAILEAALEAALGRGRSGGGAAT